MDISTEIIKTQSNRDFISIIVPGILILAIFALLFHVTHILDISKLLDPKLYLFEFVIAYTLGFLNRILSMNAIGKLLQLVFKCYFLPKFKRFNEDMHLTYYFVFLKEYFMIDKMKIDEMNEMSFLMILTEDLVEYNKLVDTEKWYSIISLQCSLVFVFLYGLVSVFYIMCANLLHEFNLVVCLISIVLILAIIIGLIKEIIDGFATYNREIIAKAAIFIRSMKQK